MSELKKHKQADKVKWAVAFFLIIVLLAGVALTVVKLWVKPDLFEPCQHEYVDGVCTNCGEAEQKDQPETVAVSYSFATLNNSTLGQAPSVMSMAETSGKFKFTDTSLTDGKIHFEVDGDYSSFSVSCGDLFSKVNNWSLNDMYELISFANTSVSFDVLSMLEEGKLQGGKTYVVSCKTEGYITQDMSGLGGTVMYMPSLDDTQNASFSFTLQTVSELPPAPTKTGYTFTGWYTDAACTKPYTDDKVIGNITLYAGFKANTYTVKFNANSGTGSMSDLAMTYDQNKALTANAFTKTGYTFKGWATSASGSVAYTNSQSVKNLASAQGATVNLYAIWQANGYTVKFNANGGTGSMSDLAMTYDQAKNLTANAFTRKNHAFKGWATSAGGAVVYNNNQSITNLTAANDETINLYAVWELITYNVSFNVDGQTTSTIEVEKNTAATLPTAPSKEGYNFIGWTLPSGELYNNQAITADTVLTAKFEIIRCVITFIVDGEVYSYYECDYGTNLSELLNQNVNTLLYKAEGEHSPNF